MSVFLNQKQPCISALGLVFYHFIPVFFCILFFCLVITWFEGVFPAGGKSVPCKHSCSASVSNGNCHHSRRLAAVSRVFLSQVSFYWSSSASFCLVMTKICVRWLNFVFTEILLCMESSLHLLEEKQDFRSESETDLLDGDCLQLKETTRENWRNWNWRTERNKTLPFCVSTNQQIHRNVNVSEPQTHHISTSRL